MFCMVVLQLQQIINLIFVGHMNDAKLLAGVGMGNLIVSVFGISLFIGLNGALETLVSQAFGNNNMKLCGIYLNRGRFMLLLLNIPIVYILCNAEAILLLLKQDPRVCSNAQRYIYSYIPALVLNGLNDSQRRFLNMMELTRIPLICQLGGTIIHIAFCLLFFTKWKMGI
jgi:MATE family multidrug resistance protein